MTRPQAKSKIRKKKKSLGIRKEQWSLVTACETIPPFGGWLLVASVAHLSLISFTLKAGEVDSYWFMLPSWTDPFIPEA